MEQFSITTHETGTVISGTASEQQIVWDDGSTTEVTIMVDRLGNASTTAGEAYGIEKLLAPLKLSIIAKILLGKLTREQQAEVILPMIDCESSTFIEESETIFVCFDAALTYMIGTEPGVTPEYLNGVPNFAYELLKMIHYKYKKPRGKMFLTTALSKWLFKFTEKHTKLCKTQQKKRKFVEMEATKKDKRRKQRRQRKKNKKMKKREHKAKQKEAERLAIIESTTAVERQEQVQAVAVSRAAVAAEAVAVEVPEKAPRVNPHFKYLIGPPKKLQEFITEQEGWVFFRFAEGSHRECIHIRSGVKICVPRKVHKQIVQSVLDRIFEAKQWMKHNSGGRSSADP